MPGHDLRETRLTTTQVYRGVLLDVRRDEVELPNGRRSVREYIRHPGAAAVVPVPAPGRVVLVRQYRYALEAETIEVPAGKRDAGEELSVTARRELAEETGYECSELMRLGLIHPSVGYSDESIEIYLARGLRRTEGRADPDEFIEPLECPLQEALEWVRQGKITDVKTIIALDWADRYLSGAWMVR